MRRYLSLGDDVCLSFRLARCRSAQTGFMLLPMLCCMKLMANSVAIKSVTRNRLTIYFVE